MKEMKDVALKFLPKREEEYKLVHAVQDAFVLKYLDVPVMNNEISCPICNGNIGYTVMIDPLTSTKRMWFCTDADCLALVKRSRQHESKGSLKQKRSLEWPLFCEINDMGDLVYDVSFEKMHQTTAKIDFLLKFAKAPQGVVIMEGDTGTGKTYASMAVCELFTRKNSSCLFYTCERLVREWLEAFKSERPNGFKERILQTNLLVIDDFGTGKPSEGFMQFFMEIINVRMLWSDRGTIITTNLNKDAFSKVCGEALADRIQTGQKLKFEGDSRRKQLIL